ncbi:MAG: sugar dehydrogenase complex small subunit [Casimicrobiaceae bacterium]
MRERRSGTVSRGGVTRREMLRGLAALAASGWMPPVLAQAAIPARFSALSTAVAGSAYSDPKVASAMLRALTQAVGSDKLARLAKIALSTPPAQLNAGIASAGLVAQAETVVAALFSGIVDTPGGPRVISYDQALVWQALAWTKPNAFCGGETNYWASVPPGMS